MLKHLTTVFFISIIVSSACVKSQTEVNAANNNSAAASNQSDNESNSISKPEAKTIGDKTNAKTFLGNVDYKRVQMNLTRDGSNLSGTYQYEKVGKDLNLSGTIDASGNFTLQESDAAGNKTGEWKGVWRKRTDEQL